ncbi:MAG: GNAT family N-acetyltransferase [Pseudomonadota bacterium]
MWLDSSNMPYDAGLTPGAEIMLSKGTTTLRPAHRSEAGAIAQLSRLHVEHGLRWRWRPARVKRSIDDAETMVLVATVEGQLAGFAVMKFGDLDAHLHLLAVDPFFRRNGIASDLVAWLEASCRTAGMRQVRLEVRLRNRPAHRFYARLGYDVVGRIPGYYDQTESALVFSKSLGA